MGIFFSIVSTKTPQKTANLQISNPAGQPWVAPNKAAASREDSIDEIARNEAPVGEPPNDLKGVGNHNTTGTTCG